MKKIILAIILIIVVYLAYHIISFNIGGSKIPDYQYYSFENITVRKKIPDENKKTFFLYALPDCNTCTDALEKLNELRKKEDFNLIVILPYNRDFSYQKDHFPTKLLQENDQILIDKKNTFNKDFGLGITAEFPTLVLYDSNQKFIGKYRAAPDKI